MACFGLPLTVGEPPPNLAPSKKITEPHCQNKKCSIYSLYQIATLECPLMSLEMPDVGLRAKPELIPLTQMILRDMCNLQAGEKVLIISDARTPEYLNHAFQGMAMAMGADAVVIEGPSPRGGATYPALSQVVAVH